MKKQAAEIIMFVLKGCGFCVKAEKVLEKEIKSGLVEIRPHTEAKGMTFARGFPALIRLEDKKAVLGAPASLSDLMKKLDESKITISELDKSRFSKIKLPPKAVQRKPIVPMKNKDAHDNKPLPTKSKNMNKHAEHKHLQEKFKHLESKATQGKNVIIFYNMESCPYCKKTVEMLKEHIEKGLVLVKPHTDAPAQLAKGFPMFSNGDKHEYGLPKSFEDLCMKLDFKPESFVIRQEERVVKIEEDNSESAQEQENKEFYEPKIPEHEMKFANYVKRHPQHQSQKIPDHLLGVM